MKKALLLITLFGSYAAHAQPKEVFDIQKYLAQKSKERKEVRLKPQFKKQFPENIFQSEKYNDINTFTLSNGDKVISLPMDNMPCVVPDMKQFQSMHLLNFVYKTFEFAPQNYFIGRMPNPATPFRIEPLIK